MEDKNIRKNPTFFKSSIIAARGLVTVFKSERKLRYAFFVMWSTTAVALWMRISYLEILFIFSAWAQVIVGEIFNTSLEKAMDYAAGKEFHPLIKRGKDYAAASVFVLSVVATIITLFIIGRKLLY